MDFKSKRPTPNLPLQKYYFVYPICVRSLARVYGIPQSALGGNLASVIFIIQLITAVRLVISSFPTRQQYQLNS